MNATTKNWIPIGSLLDIPRRGARCVKSGDTTIALFRTQDDQVFALEDKCPHKGGPLSNGIVHDGCVTCPLHNWVISLSNGEAQGADSGKTASYPIKMDGDTILIDIVSARSS
ncbi:nitrite reductase small subunit NirD [Kordiimonas sp. SCSIO 12610]|uniref:nitrite reductase small subunit NirD n=1 Tax=Kordiimonas sp. SCSIO 12610 TaxID=2829597 RepID=UPI002109E542|nr:nitrite reductase small subunit NirD [Kordiimonas sp. SCSIO 12610]UTW55346.1 nitrite reductase small subunit NirD [Kordiimonas sp. SCSIO 12610]